MISQLCLASTGYKQFKEKKILKHTSTASNGLGQSQIIEDNNGLPYLEDWTF